MHCLYASAALNAAAVVNVAVNIVVKNKQKHSAQSVSLPYRTFPMT